MRKLIVVASILMTMILASGCSSTLTLSGEERSRMISKSTDKNLKLMLSDWDRLWLVNRPSRLTDITP